MATGDVTLSIAVEGGATKTVILDSATRDKAKLATGTTADTEWQVRIINTLAYSLVAHANRQLQNEVTVTEKTFTEAT